MTEGPILNKTVQWFSGEMLAKLNQSKNLGKKHWRELQPEELLKELRGETFELGDVMRKSWRRGNSPLAQRDDIISECCDVANFAMMIADCARARAEDQSRDAGKGE